MEPIRITPTSYVLDGKPLHLNSGEFHYFRAPESDWARRLALFAEAGGNCVATYTPWIIHEPEEGRFDFGGKPWTQMERFFEAAADAGLYVMARPGPYQYSELRNHGLPDWLIERYPEAAALRIDGTPIRHASVSYLHDTFLEKTEAWFAEVCPRIAKHTISRGGPVAFAQPDNELAGIHVWMGSMDYHPETMGFGREDGRYARFLAGRYGEVAALNDAYRTSFESFATVLPAAPATANTPEGYRAVKDYFDFYCASLAEYLEILIDMMEKYGIDVPFVHNSGNPDMNAFFVETHQRLGERMAIGSDHYYCLGSDWAQNNPTPQYAVRVFYSNEMMRLLDAPPTVFELPGGSASDWPPITSEDLRTCYMTNVALGMKGHNYYVFTGGENPPGVGNNGDTYDYGAAIGAVGEVRPSYHMMKEYGAFLTEHAWLAASERECDVRVGFEWDVARADRFAPGATALDVPADVVWAFVDKGLLPTTFCASHAPALTDLSSDSWTTDLSTPVVVTACGAMSESIQERIVTFARGGGSVVIAPTVPHLDERLRPCTVIADALGGATLELLDGPRGVRLTLGDAVNIFHNGSVRGATGLPDDATVLGTDEFTDKPFAFERRVGEGRIIVLAFLWRHSRFEHTAMLRQVLERAGAKRIVECSSQFVWTSLRTEDARSMLFAMNLFTTPMEAHITCRPSWSDAPIDLGALTLRPMEVLTRELG